MAATVTAAGVSANRLVISPNWAPAGLGPPASDAVAALRDAWDLSGKFVVGYSGNLGRVHDLEPLLEVAEALRDQANIAWVFVGHGAQRASLETAAKARGLTNVHFKPPQPRAQLAVSLGVADVQLVTLLPGAEHSVFPSKLYGIAAVGRPIALIGPRGSELARLVEENKMGTAFTRDESAALARWLLALAADPLRREFMANAARHFAAGGFSRALADWQRVLGDELVGNSPQ
jgi:glycosyltransferase involved in cell wall biosynthesis